MNKKLIIPLVVLLVAAASLGIWVVVKKGNNEPVINTNEPINSNTNTSQNCTPTTVEKIEKIIYKDAVCPTCAIAKFALLVQPALLFLHKVLVRLG